MEFSEGASRGDLGSYRSVKSGGRLVCPKHDEGNAHTCDPLALGHRLIGAEVAGVDELDRNGRSLNRPVLEQSVPNQGV